MRTFRTRYRHAACGISLLLCASAATSWLACGDHAQRGSGDVADGGALREAGAIDVDATSPDAGSSVLQHHDRATRDGLYVEPSFTPQAIATMHLAAFDAPLDGPAYAQPLFVDAGPGGRAVVVVATETNVVAAFDAQSGAPVWKTPPLVPPASLASLRSDPGCGNVDPLGVTGTPVIDLASRTLFLDAMSSEKKHLVFALSLDDGGVRAGWPIDVEAKLAGRSPAFVAKTQNQRGALALLGGVLYVPYGGHWGDCGTYHGWVVAIPIGAPDAITAFATAARGGGIWAPSGIASDGASLFVTTGNTQGAQGWQQGEAVIRLGAGATFSGDARDYFAPADWQQLDDGDVDIGGTAAIPIDVAGATPSKLLVALGKNGKAYLLDRDALGGVGGEKGSAKVATAQILGAAAAYPVDGGTMVAFRAAGGTGVSCPNGQHGNVVAVRVTVASPPAIAPAWCAPAAQLGVPSVTTTDGAAHPIVWAASAARLYAIDGVTGAALFADAADAMSGVHYFQTPIVARGRVYVAGKDRLYAYEP